MSGHTVALMVDRALIRSRIAWRPPVSGAHRRDPDSLNNVSYLDLKTTHHDSMSVAIQPTCHYARQNTSHSYHRRSPP